MLKKSGYSLVESLTVILIFSVVIFVALPQIFGFTRWNALEKNETLIRSTFRRAKFLAAYKNMRHRVYFNVSGNCFYIHCDKNNNRTFDVGEKIIGPFFLTDGISFNCDDVLGPPSNPTKVPFSPVTFNKKIASCSPTGSWSNPGTIYLKDKNGDHIAITLTIKGVIKTFYWNKAKSKWE